MTDQNLNELINQFATVHYVCRADGDFGASYVSDNISHQLGYQPIEFTGDSTFWLTNIHPDDKGE